MTPLEMRFQLSLARAVIAAAKGLDNEAHANLDTAESIIEGLEAAEQPAPALGYWVLRKIEETELRYFGQIGFCTEDSPRILKFETEDAALSYRKAVNMWKVLEPVQVLPPIEPLA